MKQFLQNLPKYEKYKNSGIDWIGEIPEGWEVKRLKYVSTVYSGNSLNDINKKRFESINKNHLPYISTKDIDVDYSNIEYENGLRIPENLEQYKIAPISSSLICIEGGSAGRKVAYVEQNVCFVNKLACLVPKKNLFPKFGFYLLKGYFFQNQFQLSMSGLIGGVSISKLNNFNILYPSLKEQEAIANFLNEKTEKIDRAVRIKERQVALLKERKQILIQNAVTKGLNPNAPMKDSGVEWIGEIPAHWEVKKLAVLGKFFKGGGFSKSDLVMNGVQAILYGDIYTQYNYKVDKSKKFISKKTSANSVICQNGDLLFTSSGETKEDIGKCVFINTNEEIYIGGD